MPKRAIPLVLTFLLVWAFGRAADASEFLRLATTTSTYETGLLDTIIPPFEAANDVSVHVISVGTGRAIKLGENGDADIILVHARQAEEEFVASGYGIDRRDVMHSDFVILGPPSDPAAISGTSDAVAALRRILAARALFVSRGDESGTHMKEKHLWSMAAVEPTGNWYLEVGQGMSATLRVADDKRAYVLVDRATYLFNRDRTDLGVMVAGDPELENPYGVIAVNPDRHPHVKTRLSLLFSTWLTSPRCQQMIADYRVNGAQLFYPNPTPVSGGESAGDR